MDCYIVNLCAKTGELKIYKKSSVVRRGITIIHALSERDAREQAALCGLSIQEPAQEQVIGK